MLLACPEVTHVSVLGVPDAIRGQQVVAIICTASATCEVTAHALADLCRAQLESYKVPKRFYVCTDWPMTASGKTDHPALAQQMQMQFQPQQLHSLHEKASSCLRPLP